MEAQVEAVLDKGISPQNLVVDLQAHAPYVRRERELAALVERGQEMGIKQFSLYNMGIMPKANLEWLKCCIKGSSDD